MTEVLIGLLGSGVLAQIITLLLTLRQNRRQLNASALGTEVEALERAINVVANNFEREVERHRRECDHLRARIAELENRIAQLTGTSNLNPIIPCKEYVS